MITVGCYIEGEVTNSLLSSNVKVEEGAIVEDSVIFENTVIKKGAVVKHSIIANDVVVGENAVVGEAKEESGKISVIGEGYELADGAKVPAGEILEKVEEK